MTESGGCLTEYVSRDSRRTLTKLCIEGIGDANPMSNLSPAGILAAELGVSHRTINRWLSGGIQGCDINIERLIDIAIYYSRNDVEAALNQDLDTHRRAVDETLEAHETGGCHTPPHAAQTIPDRGVTTSQPIETGG
jgi:hypothetical protein